MKFPITYAGRLWRAAALAVTAGALLAGGLVVAPKGAQADAPSTEVFMLGQNTSDALLWAVRPDSSSYGIGNGLGIQAGTRPAMAAMQATGGFEAAWNGGGGQLWMLDANNIGHDTGYRMPVGFSPAMTPLDTGAAEVIYQNAADGLLWAVNPDGTTWRIGNGLGIQADTIPSMSPLPSGHFEVAWNGGGGQLWTIGADNIGRNTGIMMAPGASPAIATLTSGTTVIIYQSATDGLLYALLSTGGPPRRLGNGLGIAADTVPAVTATRLNGFDVAWNGGGGQLWRLTSGVGPNGPDGFSNTGQLMDPGASPAIASDWQGLGHVVWRRASDGALMYFDEFGTPTPTGLTLTAGVQPAAVTDWGPCLSGCPIL